MQNSISVVIPAYNEEKYIRNTIESISEFLKNSFSYSEIIVVDDGSSDNTFRVVTELSRRLPNIKMLKNDKNSGKGYSVKRGVWESNYDYILFTDADLSTPIEELNKFKGDFDIAIGSRALEGCEVMERQNILRQTMGRIFNLLIRTFLFKGIKDTQCGFKYLKKDAAQKIFSMQKLNGFCFDAEILYIAEKMGLRIKEIPVKWINRKDSRVRIIGSSINMFLDLFRIKINDMKGSYEIK